MSKFNHEAFINRLFTLLENTRENNGADNK